MITIRNPEIRNEGENVRLTADIDIGGRVRPLWMSVPRRYGEYLCAERSDAFVLAFLTYAMRYGHDIVFEAPMTERLYGQLTDQFLPALYKANAFTDEFQPGSRRGYRVRLLGSTAPEVQHPAGGDRIGTGVSCGVDSLHAFAKYQDVNLGCVWNVHGVAPDETPERRQLAWTNMLKAAQPFCDYIHCELLAVDSNFDRECDPDLIWDGMTTNGNLFFIFGLQKLWSKYYVASGYDVRDFRLSGAPWGDPAHYEYLLFAMLALNGFVVRMDGVAQERIHKVADLAKYEPATHYLNVCHGITDDGRNCSFRCGKCMRTMLNLDACDALDDFKEVFDVVYYRKHFSEYLAELYRGYIQKNSFYLEMRPVFSKRKYPLSVYLDAWYIVCKKAIKKILRFGKRREGVFLPRG